MSEKKSSKCMKSAHAAYVPTLPLKSVTLYRARPSFPEDLFVLDAALCAAAGPLRHHRHRHTKDHQGENNSKTSKIHYGKVFGYEIIPSKGILAEFTGDISYRIFIIYPPK